MSSRENESVAQTAQSVGEQENIQNFGKINCDALNTVQDVTGIY